MSIYPVDGVTAEAAQRPATSSTAAPASFADWLAGQIHAVNSEIVAADDSVRHLAVGDPVNLHQVMVSLERAKLHFELVVQVRNKLLEAYQDLIRMQV